MGEEPPKFPGEGYAIDTSLQEPGMFGSMTDQQMKSGTEALSACTSENGNEPQEKTCKKWVSTLPANCIDSTQTGLDGEVVSQLHEDIPKPDVTKTHSNGCQNWRDGEHAEADTVCQSSESGGSVHLMETTTATSTINTAGTGDHHAKSHLDVTEAPSASEHEDQLTASKGNTDPSLQVVSAELTKPTPDSSLHFPLVTYAWDSLDNDEILAVSPIVTKAILRERVFDEASEALGCNTNIGTSNVLSFADFPEHRLPAQETSTAVVVSNDLDGWQRFDAEDNEASKPLGFNQSIDEAPQKSLELWEQLLEDGLEGSMQCIPVSTAPVEAEIGIDSSLHNGNQYYLASPANPFIEGLERLSNFSEADGFVTNVNLVRSRSLHDYGIHAFPSSNEGMIQNDGIQEENFPGTTHHEYKVAEPNMSSQQNGAVSGGSKRVAKQRLLSFSDIRASTSRPRDSSSLSYTEQEQVHQASNIPHADGAGGEKWEANFDSMVPAIHDGPRSLSLPREATDSRRQGSFSLYSSEAPVTSQSNKLSGFLSPKLSPMVKKVVNKVWTTPDQVVRQGKGLQDVEKKESKKWTWRCCICCSHGH